MPRTSTSFKKGHRGLGGRPKGAKNGAGRDAWRQAAKGAGTLARRIDGILSELLNDPALSTDQLARLLDLVRTRRSTMTLALSIVVASFELAA
jgi:hypothetical protein